MRLLLVTLRTVSASVRMLLVFTILLGIGYPLAVTAIAQFPGLNDRADGSLITQNSHLTGSALIGQSFLDRDGVPLVQYFQPRPSVAGANGYDPTATAAGNLGPESIVDTLPAIKGGTGKSSLLSQVCSRSRAVGKLDGVDGSRAYCTRDGVGAVLAVFWSGPGYHGSITRVVSINQTPPATPFLDRYRGIKVELASYGQDYSRGQVVPIRGDAPSTPAVPADAVTASGSGLDPDISPTYARIQEATVARARGVSVAQVDRLVRHYSKGRALGFLGEPTVNVPQLNLALDRQYPTR